MTTLHARRERGDVITRFLIMEGIERVDRKTLVRTVEEDRGVGGVRTKQGASGHLTKEPFGLEVRLQFFTSSVVDPCNRLSEQQGDPPL